MPSLNFRRINIVEGILGTDTVIEIETEETGTSIITRTEINADDRASAVLSELESKIGRGRINNLFIHRNRNGTYAIATGAEPTTWPEDETE